MAQIRLSPKTFECEMVDNHSQTKTTTQVIIFFLLLVSRNKTYPTLIIPWAYPKGWVSSYTYSYINFALKKP